MVRSMSGSIVVIGSGELGPSMVPVLRSIATRHPVGRVMVMDGSYRFQTNAAELTSKIVDHLRTSVGWDAEVASGGEADPHRLAVQLGSADVVFAGPGSPTHALRHWSHPAVVEALAGVVLSGGALVMASAAALTIGARCIPIYEIYKAGADAYWANGLDVLGRLGLDAVVVPHWNNREGGTHDTSHCYIGADRFAVLEAQLSPSTLVLGIDEHTAVTLDPAGGAPGSKERDR